MSTPARRGAAIEVGTNSVRLLVADIPVRTPETITPSPAGPAPGPILRPVLRRLSITRLGEGLDASNAIRPEAAARTAAAVEEFAAAAGGLGAPNPVVLATYALRTARNPQELLSRLKRPVRVLSGEEEARLGFTGAVAALAPHSATSGEFVLDIGGGSIELTWGTLRGIEDTHSFPLGCVLLTHRFLAHDPPEPGEVAALESYVDETLAPALARLRDASRDLVGVGGTITTLAAIDQRLEPYDPDKVQGHRLSAERVRALLVELRGRPLAARRTMPGLQPERADVIIAGALVLQRVLELLGASAIRASEADMLWAVLLGC